MQPANFLPALGTLVFTLPAAASEMRLSGTDLQLHCQAYEDEWHSPSGQVCSAYVRGFLDGAASIDARVTEDDQTESESWSERAERTRLGSRVVGKPRYCIDTEVPLAQIIAQILQHAQDNPPDHHTSAHDLVRISLLRFHRC